MSFLSTSDKKRQVIPRWHTYGTAQWLNLTKALKPKSKPQKDEDFFEKVRSWENRGGLIHAIDLVGNALALNHFDDSKVAKAAKQIIKNKHMISTIAYEVAEKFLLFSCEGKLPLPKLIVPERKESFYKVISSIKRSLREYPRNPILWMELAFFYTGIGQSKKAEKCVKIALRLNKDNRYILRSASRFFLHIGDLDLALCLIRKSDIRKYDPWLVSAELAISEIAESSPKLVKSAKALLKTESIDAFHLSELASALGTLEINSGSNKSGKKLFKIALKDPTENSLAQALFLQDQIGEAGKMIHTLHPEQAFESESRIHFKNREYKKAFEKIKKWLAYQPFSSRPAEHGSYIASVVLGDFEEAIKIAEMGKISSPNDFLLNNNHAFALASLGRVDDALDVLKKINEKNLNKSNRNILKATKGLINFRNKKFQTGRQLYKEAVTFFESQQDKASEAIARLFWAREEDRAQMKEASQIKESAVNLAKQQKLNEIIFASKKIKWTTKCK